MAPWCGRVLCDGDVVCAKEDAGYAVNVEKLGGERRRVWRCESRARIQVFEEGRGYGLGKYPLIGIEFQRLVVVSRRAMVKRARTTHTSGFGVGSVCMNIVRRAPNTAGIAALWFHFCAVGLCWSREAVMGDVCWCMHLVATRGAELRKGVVRERARKAARRIEPEVISRV